MRAPGFWWKPEPTLAAQLLSPVAGVWGAIAAHRMAQPGERLNVPVICVGNFVAGGAGKTPTVLAIAGELARMGRRPFVLMRGYGGRLSGVLPVRVDVAVHTAAGVGDEALLVAGQCPVVVCADRRNGAALAMRSGADVLVMDDGLQNPALAKDLAIALVDGATGIGNGLVIPSGPLRAPMAAQWPQAGLVIVVGEGRPGARLILEAGRRGKPVLTARLAPDPAAVAVLCGQSVTAFCGIGRPEKFFETLRETGCKVIATRAFADHHVFSDRDLAGLRRLAGASSLVTTQKDLMRLPASFVADTSTFALPVTLTPDRPDVFADILAKAISRPKAGGAR